jgi:hypothetical protein
MKVQGHVEGFSQFVQYSDTAENILSADPISICFAVPP